MDIWIDDDAGCCFNAQISELEEFVMCTVYKFYIHCSYAYTATPQYTEVYSFLCFIEFNTNFCTNNMKNSRNRRTYVLLVIPSANDSIPTHEVVNYVLNSCK